MGLQSRFNIKVLMRSSRSIIYQYFKINKCVSIKLIDDSDIIIGEMIIILNTKMK